MRESQKSCTMDDLKRLNQYLDQELGPILKIAHGLARRWIDIFDPPENDENTAACVLFNETYIEAALSVHCLDPETQKFHNWFVKIMIRKIQEKLYMRKIKRANQSSSIYLSQYVNEYLPDKEDCSIDDALDLLSIQQETDQEEQTVNHIMIQQALASLRPQDREILELRYYHKYTIPEIAQQQGWSLSKTALRIYRARQRLRSTYCSV